MIVPMLFIVFLSLLFAALISRGIWGRRVFQLYLLFPNMLGGVAVSILWMNAYDPKGGLVNGAFIKLGHLLNWMGLSSFGNGLMQFQNFTWLSQEHLYWALVPIMVWGGCGFYTLLYLAAMENVDVELYEAAEMDGASPMRQFFYITILMIWDVLTISAVFLVIGGIKTFEMIWLLTSQLPTSSTHVIGTPLVSTMLRDLDVGRATAIAVVLFLLVFVASLATMRFMKRDDVAI